MTKSEATKRISFISGLTETEKSIRSMSTSTSTIFAAVILLAGSFLFVLVSPLACVKDQLSAAIKINAKSLQATLTITNTDKQHGACALKWNTMMDDMYWASAVEVWKGDENLSYSKPVIPLHQSITQTDYEYFGNGASRQFTRDLGTLFSFKNNNQYWIQIETKIQDCYKPSGNSCRARKAKQHKELEYSNTDDASKDLKFTARKGHTATKETFTQWLTNQQHPSKIYKTGGRTIFAAFGTCTTSDFNALKASHDGAKQYLKEAVNYLQDQKGATSLYEEWFGKLNPDNYNQVKKYFGETKNGLDHPFVYNCLPEMLCGKDVLAHVDATLKGKEQHVVNVCPSFFTSNEQIITSIHEMTHDSAATEDEKLLVKGKLEECYGEDLCKKLAKNDPKRSTFNADNYALFANEVNKIKQCKVPCKLKRKRSGSCSKPKPNKRRSPICRLTTIFLRKLMKLAVLNI